MSAALSRAADFIAGFEGFSAKPYTCPAGVWTIGYGSTHDANGDAVTQDTPDVTQEAARSLLEAVLATLNGELAGAVTVPLSDPQRAALLSFAYNLGFHSLRSSTLLRLLNRKSYTAAANQFLVWDHCAGKVSNGLLRRRKAERALFLSPT